LAPGAIPPVEAGGGFAASAAAGLLGGKSSLSPANLVMSQPRYLAYLLAR